MTLTTITRRVARLEYDAARLPFALLEKHVVSRYLDDDASVRLSYERFLGSMDHTVGRLLSDDEISRRGQAINHRADFLAKAATLEARADQRAEDADAHLDQAEDEALQRRREADEERERTMIATRKSELADKQKARAAADARARRAKTQATKIAERKAATAKREQQAAEKRISTNHQQATAAPKARLAEATEQHKDAEAVRSDADRLEQLAETERAARRNGDASPSA